MKRLAILVSVLVGFGALALAGEAAIPPPPPPPVAAAAPAKGGIAVTADANLAAMRTVFCSDVVAPNLLVCNNVGPVRLVGIHSPEDSSSPGYQKALKATKKFALRKSVKLEVCPVREKGASGAMRARVFYLEGGQWFDLNQKLLRAGLASAVKDVPCHLNFDSWPLLVQQARAAKRGLFSIGRELPDEFPAAGSAAAGAFGTGAIVRSAESKVTLPDVPLTIANAPKKIAYMGSINTRTFHTLECAIRPQDLDLVFFPDRFNAIKAGYKPCGVCRPK